MRTASSPPPPGVVRLWLLRLVLRTSVIERLGEDWPDPRVCTAVGVSPAVAKHENKLRARLEPELAKVESLPATIDTVSRNVELLAERLNLTDAERALLVFAAHAESETALTRCLRAFEDDDGGLYDALAVALGHSGDEIATALRADGTLRGAQLLKTNRAHRQLVGPLLLSPMLGRLLRRPLQSVDALLTKFFAPSTASSALGRDDFPHLAQEIDVAARLLRKAVETRTPGINLLLHGPPGTGKTELARVIAELAGATLYEVSVTDDEGDASIGSDRLAAYALCQRSLRAIRGAVILFDEIEDVLPRKTFGWAGVSRETGDGKGWLNRSLEQGSVPAIWITNGADHIDRAYLRRFALVVEVAEPPARVRRRILGKALDGVGVSNAYLEKLAGRRGLTPAHIKHAKTVITLVEPEAGESAELILDRVLGGMLNVLEDPATDAETFSARLDLGNYDLAYVNASIPLDEVVRGVARSRRATILLSGSPGTGKTAFVGHLGQALDIPVLAQRVSDLQSCWVGQTEKNLAAAFRRAKREGAILFLDEADSFFQSRERAVRSWELTQVNELLTRMESFDGVLVCATNLLDTFDTASMRRFDLKIRFSPLSGTQRVSLFVATLHALRVGAQRQEDPVDAVWRRELDRLTGLTPGDYAAAARRLRILGAAVDAARLLAELESEWMDKPDGKAKQAGFRVPREIDEVCERR